MLNLIGTSDGGEISSISYSTANPYDSQSSNLYQLKQKEEFDFTYQSKTTKEENSGNPEEDSIDIFKLDDLGLPEGME